MYHIYIYIFKHGNNDKFSIFIPCLAFSKRPRSSVITQNLYFLPVLSHLFIFAIYLGVVLVSTLNYQFTLPSIEWTSLYFI